MDGAVADFEGEAFPLVTTTGKDVIGNLTKNLKSYLDNKGERRKVVSATSQKLTPRRIENLKKRANELGFTLVQVYEQTSIADMLYRDPKWTKNLLNLPGDPPPLSKVPLTRRSHFNQNLIGREPVLNELRELKGDVLISGQPGSGKTSLLLDLARKDLGLFVVEEDRGKLAEGLRAQSPTRLFIDDAHVKKELIMQIKHLRNELGLDFQIVGTCWPASSKDIAHVMEIPESCIIDLPHLTRADLLEVIQSCDIYRPSWLQRELIDQSNGQPGLAVTLSEICKTDGLRELFTGHALKQNIVYPISQIIGPDVHYILAAFALGGEQGMKTEDVTSFLGLTSPEIANAITNLAPAGVIYQDRNSKLISVRPAALREALVGEVFFEGEAATAFDVRKLLAAVPNIESTFINLCRAKKRGFSVDDNLLTEILVNIKKHSTLEEYAAIGESEFVWVMENAPEFIGKLLDVGLYVAPEITLPILLDSAVGDDRMLNSNPDHPFRVLDDWLKRSNGENVLLRRRQSIDACLAWLGKGGDEVTFIKAITTSLTPHLESRNSDVVDEMKIHLGFGSLTKEQIEGVKEEWPRVLASIVKLKPQDLSPVISMVSEYLHGAINAINEPVDAKEAREEMAKMMIVDLLSSFPEHEGLKHWIARIESRRELDLEVDFEGDEEFLKIFPIEISDTEASRNDAKSLADDWLQRSDINRVIERYLIFRAMADGGNDPYPRYDYTIFSLIAAKTDKLEEWVEEMFKNRVEADLIYPFVYRLIKSDEAKGRKILEKYLHDEKYRALVVSITLQTQKPDYSLFSDIDNCLAEHLEIIRINFLRDNFSPEVINFLLQNKDTSVAITSAIGLWNQYKDTAIPEEYFESWSKAIIKGRPSAGEHWFEKLLEENPDLALPWLKDKLEDSEETYLFLDKAVNAALKLLKLEDRKNLIRTINKSAATPQLISKIVNGEIDVYHELLKNTDLKGYHLAPLRSKIGPTWLSLAEKALAVGFTEAEILTAAFSRSFSWSGPQSNVWKEMEERFKSLASNSEGSLKRMLESGAKRAKDNMEECLKNEEGDIY